MLVSVNYTKEANERNIEEDIKAMHSRIMKYIIESTPNKKPYLRGLQQIKANPSLEPYIKLFPLKAI